MTEQQGEQVKLSPELGFAFGKKSIGEALEFFTSPELKSDQQAEEIALGLGFVDDFFSTEGIISDVWPAYVEAVNITNSVKASNVLSGDIAARYSELAGEIYAQHLEFVNGSLGEIKQFLVDYPGAVLVNGQQLQDVSLVHISPKEGAKLGTHEKFYSGVAGLSSGEVVDAQDSELELSIDMVLLGYNESKKESERYV